MKELIGIMMAVVGVFSLSTAWADVKLMDAVPDRPIAGNFTLADLTGKDHALSDYRGRYVMVNFWAVWCQPCRREMPALNRLRQALKEADFEIIGIHVGPAGPGIDRFLAEVPVDFTVLVDEDMALSNWNLLGLPTTFLIDPDGRLIYKAVGEREWDAPEMLGFLERIVAKKPEYSRQVRRLLPGKSKMSLADALPGVRVGTPESLPTQTDSAATMATRISSARLHDF